jgi:hypothetical protein
MCRFDYILLIVGASGQNVYIGGVDTIEVVDIDENEQ